MGLNHIPLKPILSCDAIRATSQAFSILFDMLKMYKYNIELDTALTVLHCICADRLRGASRVNKFGFKFSDQFLFDIPAVQNELKWLLSHFYISGVEKAANNASFMCIRHMHFQAYQRLMGSDFEPCKNDAIWLLPTAVLEMVKENMVLNFPLPLMLCPFLWPHTNNISRHIDG